MGWLSRTFYGVDLDEEQARQDDLNRRLEAENRRDRDAGVLSDDAFAQYEANRRDNYISDVDGEVRDAFNTELNNRAANFRDFTGDVVGTTLLTPFKLIPPVVWLLVAGYLAFRFGLLDGVLKGVLKKR